MPPGRDTHTRHDYYYWCHGPEEAHPPALPRQPTHGPLCLCRSCACLPVCPALPLLPLHARRVLLAAAQRGASAWAGGGVAPSPAADGPTGLAVAAGSWPVGYNCGCTSVWVASGRSSPTSMFDGADSDSDSLARKSAASVSFLIMSLLPGISVTWHDFSITPVPHDLHKTFLSSPRTDMAATQDEDGDKQWAAERSKQLSSSTRWRRQRELCVVKRCTMSQDMALKLAQHARCSAADVSKRKRRDV